MKHIDIENVNRAKEQYPLVCERLAKTKAILEAEKLNPSTSDVLEMFRGRLKVVELFQRMKKKEMEQAAPIDQSIIKEQITQRSEYVKSQLPERIINHTILSIPLEKWNVKNAKFSVDGINQIIEAAYTTELTPEQVKVVGLLQELAAQINKAHKYFQERSMYFPDLFQSDIPGVNRMGEVDLKKVLKLIKR